MSLLSPKLDESSEEPQRYYEWMLWKMRQDESKDNVIEERLKERVERSKEYKEKTVDERAHDLLVLKDRIKRPEEDMAYMKKETHE